MTFARRESSRSLGRPQSYFLFRYGEGTNDIRALTDAAENETVTLTLDGNTTNVLFEASTIEHSDLVETGSPEKSKITVSLDNDDRLVDLFRFYPPSSVVTVTIYQGHEGDAATLGVWSGRVIGYSSDLAIAELTCEPASTAMRRPGLRRRWQRSCPLVLYGSQCRAPKIPTSAAVISAVSGAVKLNANWSNQKAKFAGGIFEWQNSESRVERRTIIGTEDDGTILLGGPSYDIEPGDAVTLYLGCNHLTDDCESLHDNILNFGGQPYIPTENPVGLKNIYY